MTRMRRPVALAIACIALGSCSARQPSTRPPGPSPGPSTPVSEPRYEGRSLSDWMGQLQDADAKARVGAASALARLGPRAAPAVPLLIGALTDRDKLVRTQSIAALGKIGPGAAAALPALARLVEDDDWATRNLAMAAAAAIQQQPLPDNAERDKVNRAKAHRYASPPS